MLEGLDDISVEYNLSLDGFLVDSDLLGFVLEMLHDELH